MESPSSDPRFPDYSRHTHDQPAPRPSPSVPQLPVEPVASVIPMSTAPSSASAIPVQPAAPQSVVIVGAGLGGLAAACLLSAKGYKVTVVEKEQEVGGWANPEAQSGFLFDRVPGWYMFPNLYEHIFSLCGEQIKDHVQLTRLNPSHRLVFKDTDHIVDMRSDVTIDGRQFEEFEKGDTTTLEAYLETCKQLSEAAMNDYLFENRSTRLTSLLTLSTTRALFKAGLFSSLERHTNPAKGELLRKALQYQAVVLGSNPATLPALYAASTHQDFESGILYPQGGLKAVAQALKELSVKHGAQYRCGQEVSKIIISGGAAVGVELTGGQTISAQYVISNADLHQAETSLLPAGSRQNDESFWKSAPLTASAFVLNLGITGTVDQLLHHTVVFSKDWNRANDQIFNEGRFASDPSFYISMPSKTDRSYAPEGQESVTVFVPIPARKHYTDEDSALYTEQILRTLEHDVKISDIRARITYQKAFCLTAPEYTEHAFGGSMFGLAHNAGTSAVTRHPVVSGQATNLYHVGANTQPGIGQAMSLAAAERAVKHIIGSDQKGPLTTL